MRQRMFISYLFSSSCAVSNLKKVSLELGGKSPLIIFNDCELDKAVRMVRVGRIPPNRCLLLNVSHLPFYQKSKQKPFSQCLDWGLRKALNFKNGIFIVRIIKVFLKLAGQENLSKHSWFIQTDVKIFFF